MKGNKSIYLLIILCALLFIGLSIIQYKLIQNTYKLHIKEYKKELISKTSEVLEDEKVDALEDEFYISLMKILRDKSSDAITLKETKNNINKLLEKTDLKKDSLLNTLKGRYKVLENTNFSILIDSISIYDKTKENIIPLKELNNTHIFKNQNKDYIKINSSTTRAEHISDQNIEKLESNHIYGFLLYAQTNTYAHDFHLDIWKEMFWLLVFSILIFLSIILIFFFVISRWLKQKKLTEVQEDFSNNVTHELKTPLASLFISNKTLQNPGLDANLKSDIIKGQNRQLKKLDKIINNVLESSFNNTKVQLEQINLRDFFYQYTKDLYLGNHVLNTEIKGEENFISNSSLNRLERILDVFIDNAQKYSQLNTEIKLTLYKEKKHIYLSVEDNGIGIKPSELKSIFNKYYRTKKDNYVKGLGLGLYMAQKYAEEIQAEILVKKNKEKGSIFILKLKAYD